MQNKVPASKQSPVTTPSHGKPAMQNTGAKVMQNTKNNVDSIASGGHPTGPEDGQN